jgi:aspartate kinase
VIVMKFGGTSLGDRERIDTVVKLVKSRMAKKPVVVCSAHSGITDMLLTGAKQAARGQPDLEPVRQREAKMLATLGLAASLVDEELERLEQMYQGLKLLGELTPRSLDAVASFGERMSCKTVAAYFRKKRVPATYVQADQAGLVTNSRYTRASPLPEAYGNLKATLSKVKGLPIVTGWIGRDLEGNVTTLGRSGSDYTATIVGKALGAEEVEIWTDVSGVLTADPRIVPEARPVATLTYAEASELAYYGAKVIHPSTIHPAVEQGIPVRVLNTMDPGAPGTVILPTRTTTGAPLACIASKRGIRLVNIVSGRMLGQSGFMSTVFHAFQAHDVVVDLVATSEVSVTVSVDSDEGLDRVVADLSAVGHVTIERGNGLVAIVGEAVQDLPGLAHKAFAALAAVSMPIRAISYGGTKTNLQLVVPEERTADAVRTLHRALFAT